jgi:hypothetical protein
MVVDEGFHPLFSQQRDEGRVEEAFFKLHVRTSSVVQSVQQLAGGSEVASINGFAQIHQRPKDEAMVVAEFGKKIRHRPCPLSD